MDLARDGGFFDRLGREVGVLYIRSHFFDDLRGTTRSAGPRESRRWRVACSTAWRRRPRVPSTPSTRFRDGVASMAWSATSRHRRDPSLGSARIEATVSSETAQTRKRNHPRHRVLDTSPSNNVKAPQDLKKRTLSGMLSLSNSWSISRNLPALLNKLLPAGST